jgi:predicted dehydrogenase
MIWLIGAGPMAMEYARVLNAQGLPFVCVTRSESSATKYRSITGGNTHSGGLQKFLLSKPMSPRHAIVATGIESLASVTELLLRYGAKSILVEKPAGITILQVENIQKLVEINNANVFVAYNRRFYESVITAQKMIEEDGGVTSLTYEITEWSHIIDKLDIDESIKRNWFIANTSHVIDLAFYLGGKPEKLASFTEGNTNWHNRSAIFAGAGITDVGALFSYTGNWNAPGRWSLDVLTSKRRYIFRPLEKLQIQKIGEVENVMVPIDNELDVNFKPGVFLQVEAFLNQDANTLCDINEHMLNLSLYCKMANYEL